jgi:hypothetical protein
LFERLFGQSGTCVSRKLVRLKHRLSLTSLEAQVRGASRLRPKTPVLDSQRISASGGSTSIHEIRRPALLELQRKRGRGECNAFMTG